jgi:hypothetical protein
MHYIVESTRRVHRRNSSSPAKVNMRFCSERSHIQLQLAPLLSAGGNGGYPPAQQASRQPQPQHQQQPPHPQQPQQGVRGPPAAHGAPQPGTMGYGVPVLTSPPGATGYAPGYV